MKHAQRRRRCYRKKKKKTEKRSLSSSQSHKLPPPPPPPPQPAPRICLPNNLHRCFYARSRSSAAMATPHARLFIRRRSRPRRLRPRPDRYRQGIGRYILGHKAKQGRRAREREQQMQSPALRRPLRRPPTINVGQKLGTAQSTLLGMYLFLDDFPPAAVGTFSPGCGGGATNCKCCEWARARAQREKLSKNELLDEASAVAAAAA